MGFSQEISQIDKFKDFFGPGTFNYIGTSSGAGGFGGAGSASLPSSMDFPEDQKLDELYSGTRDHSSHVCEYQISMRGYNGDIIQTSYEFYLSKDLKRELYSEKSILLNIDSTKLNSSKCVLVQGKKCSDNPISKETLLPFSENLSLNFSRISLNKLSIEYCMNNLFSDSECTQREVNPMKSFSIRKKNSFYREQFFGQSEYLLNCKKLSIFSKD